MAKPYRVQVLNQISAHGLKRLPAELYEVGKDIADPDAIRRRIRELAPNNIPVAAMSARGVPVFNAPGANANAVKELVLAGMLMAARNLPAALQFVAGLDATDPNMDSRVEDGKKAFVGFELTGHTLGVIGLGRIGCLVADAAIRLGMHVIGYDPDITVDAAWSLPAQVRKAHSVAELHAWLTHHA